MSHEDHHPQAALTFFASPLRPEAPRGSPSHAASIAASEPKPDEEAGERGPVDPPGSQEMPEFQRHAEASNHELFFDLCKTPLSVIYPRVANNVLSCSLRRQSYNVHVFEGD